MMGIKGGHAGAPAARRGLEQTSQAVHQILERVGEGFVALDREWRYTYVNTKAAEILGRRAEDLVGAHAWTEFPDAVGGTIHGALEKAMATQQPAFVEDYFEPWDRWFENRIYPSESGLSIFFTEITERKRAEAALEQAQRERERLHAEVEAEKRRLRQLSRRLLAAQEEERGRISRDLHDDLAQVLTGVRMSLGSMVRRVRSSALLAALADAIESVDRGLAWTRDLSLQLHPPMLDLLGLGATLRWYLEERRWQGPPTTHLCVEIAETRLPRVIETTCFRVMQEAVTNVLRHARARNLWVEARETPEALQLSVRDDGCGFDFSAARAEAAVGTSAGLSGMQERVALARGQLEVLSRPGTGTQVTVRFPLRAAASSRGL